MKNIYSLALSCICLTIFLSTPAAAQNEEFPEQSNRETVLSFYQAAFDERDPDQAVGFLGQDFIQHHPEIGDGSQGMLAYVAALAASEEDTRREVKRVLTDGEYVIVQAHQFDNTHGEGAVTGDIFRLENNIIVEQWGIIHPITETPDQNNVNDVFGTNSAPFPNATSTAQERRNLALATGFYNAALNEKDWDKASEYLGENYQQHSIYMEDGRAGFQGLVERIKREFPNNLGKIRQSFADGDMVVLNLEVSRDKDGLTYNVIELMRLENDKVVEHWDIFQRLSDVVSRNSNDFW